MTRSVLVPSSLVREAEDKREATRKLGYVARAAAVFRADRLVVFPDRDGERNWGGGFVETVLRYAATPPYLRKEAFDTRDELEYAGVLPPLRLSSWTGSDSSGSGSLRQGIVTQVGSEGRVRVNCGMQHPVSLQTPPGMEVEEGERVTIRVSSRRPVRAKLVDEPLPGFSVERTTLGDALGRPDAGVRIATSRHGTPLSAASLGGYVERIARDGLTVAFGAPERGLPPMLGLEPDEVGSERASSEGLRPSGRSSGRRPREDGDEPRAAEDDVSEAVADQSADAPAGFDAWLNTIPDQGSEVVRTEEAMFATLGCLTLTE